MQSDKILASGAYAESQAKRRSYTPSFDLLYIMYSPPLLGQCFIRYYKTPDRLISINNLFWATIWTRLNTYKSDKSSLYTWLYLSATRFCKDELRKEAEQAAWDEGRTLADPAALASHDDCTKKQLDKE